MNACVCVNACVFVCVCVMHVWVDGVSARECGWVGLVVCWWVYACVGG